MSFDNKGNDKRFTNKEIKTMTITICQKSTVLGLFLGVLFTASAWFGWTLNARAEITQAMLAQAKCDPAGFVSITFTDSSQFTCSPTHTLPPTSREEATTRARAGRGAR
jgi:hypothetical protein